jgi:hypothetical protein
MVFQRSKQADHHVLFAVIRFSPFQTHESKPTVLYSKELSACFLASKYSTSYMACILYVRSRFVRCISTAFETILLALFSECFVVLESCVLSFLQCHYQWPSTVRQMQRGSTPVLAPPHKRFHTRSIPDHYRH